MYAIKWNEHMFNDLERALNDIHELNRRKLNETLNDKKIENKSCRSLSKVTIKKVIYNNPATIIFWSDNTKTVAKCESNEPFDKEKGFMVAYLKKYIGNKNLHKLLKDNVWNYPENEKVKK